MEIIQKNHGGVTSLALNTDELRAIRNALNESLELIEDWEYETRMGVSKNEVTALLDQLRQLSE